ncbi:MAG: hypothetical protein ABW168_15790, partial [Sedimenticola sp.]
MTSTPIGAIMPGRRRSRDIAKLVEKTARYESHISFLQACIDNNIITNGFKLKWRLCIGDSDEIAEKCEKVKHDAALNLMTLAAQAAREKLTVLAGNIAHHENMFGKQPEIVSLETNWKKKFSQKKLKKMRALKRTKVRRVVSTGRRPVSGGNAISDRSKLEVLPSMSDDTRRVMQASFGLQPGYTPPTTLDMADSSSSCLVKVQGDGNCFYRCVSVFLTGHEVHHSTIRAVIGAHMSDHVDDYSPYVDGEYEKQLEDQQQMGGSLRSWATEAQILATASILRCTIQVRSVHGHLDFAPLIGDSEHDVKLVLMHSDNHFNVILPCLVSKSCIDSVGGIHREGAFMFHETSKFNMSNCNNHTVSKGFCWFDMTDNTGDSTTVTSRVADNPKIDVQSQPKRNRSTPKLDCIERKNG